MRYIPLCSAIFVAMIQLAAPTAESADPWCLVASGREGGGTMCRFRSYEQCMESARGTGGSCYPDSSNPQAAPPNRNKASGTEQRKNAAPGTASKTQPEPAKTPQQPIKQAAPTPAAQPAALQQPANNFTMARQLILSGQYEAGIKAMRALGFDEHPDVAAYIGLANNKLSRSTEAKSWYEKALTSDPNHLLTLSYYGMLRVEQGELPKAQDDLEKIKRICGGTGCKEYIALDGVIASKRR